MIKSLPASNSFLIFSTIYSGFSFRNNYDIVYFGGIFISGELQIFLGGTVVQHQGDETVSSDIDKTVFGSDDNGDISGGSGRDSFFVLLVGEDINTSDGGLGSTVLTGLGGGQINDLERTLTISSRVRKIPCRDIPSTCSSHPS